jgi:outer membrane murein-binding lipoprotein Lpp
MKRPLTLSALLAGLLTLSGCGSSKPEVPSWFKSNGGNAKKTTPTTKMSSDAALTDLSGKVKQLSRKITALNTAIESVQKEKKVTVAKLRQRGVTSSESLKNPDIRDDRTVKFLLEALERDSAEEAKYRQLRDEFEILQLEAQVTQVRLERHVKLAKEGISEKDLEDLEVALRKIDARLKDDKPTNPVDVLKAPAILDKELKDF